MEACSCGRTPAFADRFCGACGSALSSADHEDVLMEGTVVGEVRQSDSEVRSSSQLRFVLLGVIAVGALIVGLSQWPTGEAVTGPSADAESESADAEAIPAEQDSQANEDDTSAADQNATTTTQGETIAPQPTGPVVGEPIGLGLIIGRLPDTGLRLLNLDSGEVVDLAAAGEPLGVLGSTLVFRNDDRVLLADLATAEDEGTRMDAGAGWIEITSITEDRVWVNAGSGPDGMRIVGYDKTGTETDRVIVSSGHNESGPDPAVELVQNASGIYRRTGDEFKRVSSGTLVLAGARLALVRECNEQMLCRFHWYDRVSWDEQLEKPLPEIQAGATAALYGNDRWLTVADRTTGATNLYDVETGEKVRDLKQMGSSGSAGVAISPDGRWLIDRFARTVVVVDLDTGQEWPFIGASIHPETVAVFVDLERVLFGQ